MGIRPSIQAIFGIDDLQTDLDDKWKITDQRLSSKDWSYCDSIEIPKRVSFRSSDDWDVRDAIWSYLYDHKNKSPFEIGDKLVYDPEYGLSNVIGMSLGEDDYDNLGWFLSACDKKFSEPGYMVANNYNFYDTSQGSFIKKVCETCREKGTSSFSYLRSVLKDREIQKLREYGKMNQLYPHHDWVYVKMWTNAAIHLFKQIGLTVEPRELKLMVYWKWS